MAESITERIQKEMTAAMKSRDADTLSTLRMLKAALTEARIAKGADATLAEGEEIDILARYEKKRHEAMAEARAAAREELARKEEAEVLVVRRFLPQAMGEEEVRKAVQGAVAASGAAGPRDMGKVMGLLMKELRGRASGDLISRLVKEALGG